MTGIFRGNAGAALTSANSRVCCDRVCDSSADIPAQMEAAGATEIVVADLFCAADVKHQTETQLLEWLKRKAIAEYEKKGFSILAFEVESMQLESSTVPDRSVKAFFHGQYGRVKDNDGIRARVKLHLIPVGQALESKASAPAIDKEKKKEADGIADPDPKSEVASKGTEAISASAYDNAGFLEDAGKLLDAYSTTLGLDVAAVFQNCFSDNCAFEEEYHKARSDTDVVIGKWEQDSKFGTLRHNTYTIKLSGPIGPPTSRAQETQRYNLQADKLTVDMFVVLLDAPYGDHFRVESQWLFAASGGGGCSADVKAKPMFSKSTMLESTITKKTLSGMKESLEQWMNQAKDKATGGPSGDKVNKGSGEAEAKAKANSNSKPSSSKERVVTVPFWQQYSVLIFMAINIVIGVIAIIVYAAK